MKLRTLPALGAYSLALLAFLFAGGFWLQYLAIVQTVDGLANALMLTTIGGVLFTLGYGFDTLEAKW